jgi:zinc and cadmium transporter
MQELLYIFGSVFLVSIIALIGVITLSFSTKKINKILLYLVSFSAGALLGDAFLHLIPETTQKFGFSLITAASLLSAIIVFLIVEKIIKWHHCHDAECHEEGEKHTFTHMNLIGDGIHNLLDGLLIASSYLVSIPLGIATTLAVILHEIPQEIGDYGVLLHGGFTKIQAIKANFLTALMAFVGAIIAIILFNSIEAFTEFILPFTAGAFIYIAGTDLIPEIQKETNLQTSIIQIFFIILGIGIMAALLFI